MAFCLLTKPSPTRVMFLARMHHTAPSIMRASDPPSRLVGFCSSQMLPKDLTLSGCQSFSLYKHSWIALSASHMQLRCFCAASGSQKQSGSNPSNAGHGFQGQQPTNSYTSHHQQSSAQPASISATNTASQQPGQGASAAVGQGNYQSNSASASPHPSTSSGAAACSPPRTSAAAEVIDKYLGPSTLKLEKRDDKATPPPPPPPPPRRNYGPQGTQEKKSGKDLVAESAACAVIEKYLGPWPGFPPRDPKIDEYLDSLPENAACAAIDKYFGPYKPLFVFKKNEENANNPPPPSRPPRNRMMNRARNRQWNASQQGASVDRPWTAPQQQAPTPNIAHSQPNVGSQPPSQVAAASSATPQSIPPQNGTGMPTHAVHTPSQADATPLQQGSSTPHGTLPPPPHSAASGQ